MKRFSDITPGSPSDRNRSAENTEKRKQHQSILWAFFILTAVIGCVGISGLVLYDTEELIQGQAEAVEYCISSQTTGRLLNLYVHEGDYVRAGDTVATMSVPHTGNRLFQGEKAQTRVALYAGRAILTAPMAGEVVEIYPKPGESIDAGSPIMSLARQDAMWAVFNVREDQLGTLAVGKEFTAFLPAFDRDIALRVTRLKGMGTRAMQKAVKAIHRKPKTIEVKAVPVRPFAGLRPGMSVIIRK